MFDWLITDALVMDGKGSRPFSASVAIEGERIAAVGHQIDGEAREILKAEGRITAPGFIDMHSHSDILFLNSSLPKHKIWQGVTTEVIGQDGMSVAPLTQSSKQHMVDMLEPLAGQLREKWNSWGMAQFLKSMERRKTSLNVVTFVGHCNLRLAAMGYRRAAPSSSELVQMERLLSVGLEQGAFGLSLGLIYPPSSYSTTDELISLGRVVRRYDALLVAHIRNEQENLHEALDEIITVGQKTGCRVHISHLKCVGKSQWGGMEKVLEELERAVQEGTDLSFDQYPYTASCTSLSVLLPEWALEGGWEAFHRRLKDSEIHTQILSELSLSIEGRGGASGVVLVSVPKAQNKEWAGKTLLEISQSSKESSEKVALRLLTENHGEAIAIYHSMAEKDVECAMAHFLHTVGSDGILGTFPHPRAYGTFPRILSKFCLEKKLFPLEEAIRKMTCAPAQRLKLKGRGCIEPGTYADLLIFDSKNFRDTATYDHPEQFASGLDWMFLNGRPLVREGKLAEGNRGQVLRRV